MIDDIDCYGYLYDELLSPCRDKCELRHRCKQKVEKKLKKLGEEEFFYQKKQVMLASEALAQSETSNSRRSYFESAKPTLSKNVQRIIDVSRELGLKAQFKKYYIVIKDKKRRSMLHISKLQSPDLSGLVRFVRIDNREDYSTDVKKFISFEKCCGQFYFTGETLEEFTAILKTYLSQVGAVL